MKAVLGGKAAPSAADIKSILGAVGAEAEDDRIEALLKELAGKDIKAVIAEGAGKLASVPSGGGGGGAPAAAAASGGGAAPAKEEKKKEEPKEEEDEDLGFSLFD